MLCLSLENHSYVPGIQSYRCYYRVRIPIGIHAIVRVNLAFGSSDTTSWTLILAHENRSFLQIFLNQ